MMDSQSPSSLVHQKLPYLFSWHSGCCFQLSILRIILHCLPVSNLCGTWPTYCFYLYFLPWWALMLTPSGNTHELLLRVPYPGLQVSEASLFCISLGYLNTLNLAYLKLGPIIRYKMVFISTISSNIFGVAKLKLQAILNSLSKWLILGWLPRPQPAEKEGISVLCTSASVLSVLAGKDWNCLDLG